MKEKVCKDCNKTDKETLFPKEGRFCKACKNGKEKQKRNEYNLKAQTSNEQKICNYCGVKKIIKEFSYGYVDCKSCFFIKNKEKEKKEINKEKFCKNCNVSSLDVKINKRSKLCKHCMKIKSFEENKIKKEKHEEKIRLNQDIFCSSCENFKKAILFVAGDYVCKECSSKYNKNYAKENKEKISKQRNEYYQKNKEIIKQKARVWEQNNKEKVYLRHKQYEKDNITSLKEYRKDYYQKNKQRVNNYKKEKRKTDVCFKLHTIVSSSVGKCLRASNNRKNGKTINYLPFESWQQLKQHIESLFEPWMTWDNWGKYNPETWDDKDSNTWTWQIDHIAPQSDFPYDSMEHPNFKKCWALENLRPYSAKQNLLDGVNRTRHKKSA